MNKIHAIPTLTDNYTWLMQSTSGPEVIIFDPGESTAVISAIFQQQLSPIAILNTHQHYDHIDGIKSLVEKYHIPVYGSELELVPELSHVISSKSSIDIHPAFPELKILNIPGHTAGHIAYLAGGNLFCGDTIFSAGCGRLLGGTAEQLYNSIQKLSALPTETNIYCSHELTQINLLFAEIVEPNNQAIVDHKKHVATLLKKGLPTLPSTIGLELKVNPFLRCDKTNVIDSAEQYAKRTLNSPAEVFAVLRIWKDRF